MQLLARARDGHVRLARARTPHAERQVVHADLVHVLALVRSAATDAAALRVHDRLAATTRRLLRDRAWEPEFLHAEMHAVGREGFLRRQFEHPGEHR